METPAHSARAASGTSLAGRLWSLWRMAKPCAAKSVARSLPSVRRNGTTEPKRGGRARHGQPPLPSSLSQQKVLLALRGRGGYVDSTHGVIGLHDRLIVAMGLRDYRVAVDSHRRVIGQKKILPPLAFEFRLVYTRRIGIVDAELLTLIERY